MSDSTSIAPDELNEVAERIRNRIRRFTTDIIANGEDLTDIKSRLPHGEFIGWIDREFGMTTRTAQRYIQAAEWAKGKNDIVSHLPPTTIYLLAAPSTPAEFTERVVADLDAGQVIDHAALQKEIRQRRGADDTLDTQPDYPTFRKKIGAPVCRSQEARIDEFELQIYGVFARCEALEDVYIERGRSPDFEAHYIAQFEQAQRDLKRFLNRLNATYSDRGDQ